MILAVLFANSEGNILVERFNGVPAEERLHWRSFLVKLGADNLKGVKNEELLVASHKYEYLSSILHFSIYLVAIMPDSLDFFPKLPSLLAWPGNFHKWKSHFESKKKHSLSVYIVYTVLGDVSVYVVGKDEYDELALAEVIFVITSAVKDVCGKLPTERLFLDKYGRICLTLDEIIWKGYLENTDKDRIRRLVRLKPPTEF
ncbi:SNARE-like superfamily protein isoform 1 [Gossypium australe]|uniref:Coatomer subunit zeta n=1 Tax=Gossypium australe TaxID=47621 RepID=A0A5B6WF49_9ROSI|nr:SNARE-like superfamily protein isoform 1 [Gossypium australe]